MQRTFISCAPLEFDGKSKLDFELGNTFNRATNMTASGLPPHITQFYEFQNLKDSLKDLMTEHQIQSTAQISSITDRLQVLEEGVKKVPQVVANEIKSNFNIKGVVQVSARDVESIFESKFSRLEGAIGDKFNEFITRYLSNGISISSSSDNMAVVDAEVASSSDIPASYKFPSLDVQNLWSSWFRGSMFKDPVLNVTYAIKPFYKCNAGDFKNKKDQHMLSKCRKVINYLLSGDSNLAHDQVASTNEGAQFYGTLDRLCRVQFGVGDVKTSSKVSTLYDVICKSQGTKRAYKRKAIIDDSVISDPSLAPPSLPIADTNSTPTAATSGRKRSKKQ